MTTMTLTDRQWESALTILLIAVVADHRLRDPELVEFCHIAKDINATYFPDRLLTPLQLKNWLFANKEEVEAKVFGVGAEDYINQCLNSVTDKKLRLLLLKGVFNISICDYELDDEEAKVLKLAMAAWDLTYPIYEEDFLVV